MMTPLDTVKSEIRNWLESVLAKSANGFPERTPPFPSIAQILEAKRNADADNFEPVYAFLVTFQLQLCGLMEHAAHPIERVGIRALHGLIEGWMSVLTPIYLLGVNLQESETA